tara:strand:- start:724 stop:1437 length:714 start_codon:yes stop_codon:yes gene_type:complete
MSLIPESKSPIVDAASAQVITVIGEPGIGKSTFASQFPNALFAATEPGLNFLEVYQAPITSWGKFKTLCKELSGSPKHIETLIIDTIDILYLHCTNHHNSLANDGEGVEHASDNGKYGRGFGIINSDFRRVLSLLPLLRTNNGNPMGLVFVTHAKEIEVDTRTGKINQWRSTLSGKAAETVTGMSDIILFLTVHNNERIILTDKSERYTAKDRTGRLPAKLPLNYAAFAAALGGENE